MSQFSTLERKLARILSRSPVLKYYVKALYTCITYFFYRKPYKFKSEYNFERVTSGGKESFFGYYDKSPRNFNYTLCYQVNTLTTDKAPSIKDKVSLVVVDENNDEVFKQELKAFNWQQGARAQWINQDAFIYNDYDAESRKYVSKVYSLKSQKLIKVFDLPVQDSYSDQYFLSINYQRLMSLRPDYGYRNLPGLSKTEIQSLDRDGIWKVDFESCKSFLFISLKDIVDINPRDEFLESFHKVNHVMISPNGSKFIFIHRYTKNGVRSDRLMLAASESGQPVELVDYGMVSHCFWLNNENIFGYMRGKGRKDGYWIVNITTGEMEPFYQDLLGPYGDGHPNIFGEWVVTDTYPNKSRMQSLLLINWRTGEMRKLGEFFHPLRYHGESRCDLHPRFGDDGKSIFFDSIFTGERHLYKMDVF